MALTKVQEGYIGLLLACCADWSSTNEFKFIPTYRMDRITGMHALLGTEAMSVIMNDVKLMMIHVGQNNITDRIAKYASMIPQEKHQKVMINCARLASIQTKEFDRKVMYLIRDAFGIEIGDEFTPIDPLKNVL